MLQQQWWQLELEVGARSAEAIGRFLIQEGSLGLEERPLELEDALAAAKRAESSEQSREEHQWMELAQGHEDWKALKRSSHRLLVAYFDESFSPSSRAKLVQSLEGMEGVEGEAHWSLHRDDGWSTNWKAFYKPLVVGERLVICPSWEAYECKPEQRILWLEPGMAFGTGQHGTTQGCILFMERYLQPGMTVLDVGCGSGILAIAAVMLGASSAYGIDIDADVIPVAIENAKNNEVGEQCGFDDKLIDDVDAQYPFVVANIQAHILKPMSEALVRAVAPEGHLLLSGILEEQADDVCAHFEAHGLSFLEQMQIEEWCSLVFSAVPVDVQETD